LKKCGSRAIRGFHHVLWVVGNSLGRGAVQRITATLRFRHVAMPERT
jgi:hypothetical protein